MMVRFYSYFFFLSFSSSFLGSYTLADIENNLPNNEIWETKEVQTAHHGLDLNQKHQRDWSNFGNENQIPKIDPLTEGNGGKGKWSSVLTFDRLKNLTEKDKGPGNDTKVIFINSEDRLTIYENDDDDDDDADEENETGIQDHDRRRFSLLTPEGFLSRIHSSEEKSLERSKRQAEGGRKKCKCRRRGRKVVRRRRRRRRGRRRRVGQARQGRRRRRGRRRGAGRRRRGRRRCVCRKNGGGEGGGGGGEGEGGEEDGEGKGEEEPEIEEADGGGETTTTEGGEDNEGNEEGENEGDEEEGEETMGDGDEEEDEEGDKGKEEEEEEEENEDSEDEESMESEDESDEKGKSEESSERNIKKKHVGMSGVNHEVPVYTMYPGTPGAYGAAPNAAGTPTYTSYPVPFSPYPYYTGNKE